MQEIKDGETIYAPHIAEAKGKNCTFVTELKAIPPLGQENI